jgi:hypothetical protein
LGRAKILLFFIIANWELKYCLFWNEGVKERWRERELNIPLYFLK